MRNRVTAQALLDKYAITDPYEIDLEAIAHCENAEVRYESIKGSEARLLGLNNKAIITINENAPFERQRFSLAHELGHWVIDRGTIGKLCKREDTNASAIQNSKKIDWGEIAVNKFAADLIMPMHFFKKSCNGHQITFDTVENLRVIYKTSKLSTAIRLIDVDEFPCALAYSENQKIHWMHKSNSVPKGFYYHDHVGNESVAAMLNSKEGEIRSVCSDNWFSIKNAENYSILENSIPYYKGILSLLWWKNESQILSYNEYHS